MSEAKKMDTPEQAAFRAHCKEWLASNHPGRPTVKLPLGALELSNPDALAWLQKWQKSAYDAGLIGCDYPKEVGGGGMENCQSIANAEMQRVQTPYLPNIIGMGMAAPTVLFHARDEVKAELLPKLLSGEEIWCQGFSEPGAGSDLVSLQTSAVKDGDNWVVNGSKVWTSLGHFAKWMLLLARTDKNDKYNGITYFIASMEAQGVTVQPIHKMTGESGFNEVFLEEVVVPDHYRIDEVGKGWQVAMSTLTNERGAGTGVGAIASSESPFAAIEQLIALAKREKRNGRTLWEDPVWRDKLMKLYERTEAATQNFRRLGVKELNGGAMRIPLQGKLTGSELGQELHQTALSMLGMKSSLYIGDPNAEEDGRWALGYMNTYTGTISGGSSEIQRNILGERVLGLPKTK